MGVLSLIRAWMSQYPRAYAVARRVRLGLWAAFYRAGYLLLRRPRSNYVFTAGTGLRWVCDPGNALDSTLTRNGGLYSWTIGLALRLVSEGCLVADVGANAGYWTLPLAASGARVLAFEPDPAMAKKLRANLAANPAVLNRVTALQAACGSEAALRPLFVRREVTSEMRMNAGLSSFVAGTGTVDTITVEVTTLDVECARTDSPLAFVKIDVEGFESEVLRGASHRLRSDRPIVFWEALQSLDATLGRTNVADSFRQFEGLSYRHLALSPEGEATEISDSQVRFSDCDVMSTPSERWQEVEDALAMMKSEVEGSPI